MSRLLRLTCVAALLSATGAQWTVLQLAAWGRMACASWRASHASSAVAAVLDGRHPCAMCRLVAKGARSQRRQQAAAPAPKLHLAFSASLALRPAPRAGRRPPAARLTPASFHDAVDPPPPRLLPV